MAADPSEHATCWTCRLRHKKCDQKNPICGNCSALGIKCHSGRAKPQWMDGGTGQQAMATQLKIQVKQAARRRRGVAMMDKITQELADPDLNDALAKESSTENRPCSVDSGLSSGNGGDLSFTRQFTQQSRQTEAPSESDLGYIVAYMDYVFPILFPHYRPPIVHGGRSWLLSLPMISKSCLKGLVSLSSMFLSIVPSEISPNHEACVSKTWEELRKQGDMALAAMQHDLKDITGRGLQDCLLESVHLLASAMQLLLLDLTIMTPTKWEIHLNAAIGLFEQIMDHHGRGADGLDTRIVLDKVGELSGTAPGYPSTDQSAFRFFAALLMFGDVIASTSLGQSPRLRTYLSDLVHGGEPNNKPSVSLEQVIGCQDWLIHLLGDIAALNEWKRDRSRPGELLRSELLHRGNTLNERLEIGLENMDRSAIAGRTTEPTRPLEALFNHSTSVYGPPRNYPDTRLTVTRIWAYAIRIYLFAVIMNGRFGDANIRENVEQAICLLMEIRSPIWLRSLSWPICIIGCYVTQGQRPAFETIAGRMSALGGFGTGRLALDIPTNVWRQRDPGYEDSEPSFYLQSSGRAVLLL